MALGGAFRETLTRHAVLLKQAAAFRARPDDFAPLLAERGGIGRKDLHAFEELHARARRHRRAATMRLVHRIKKEAEQQRLKPEMRQAAQPIQDGVVEAAATIPAEGIQPAGPDDGRLHTPAQAAPPIETVAMPIERDLAGYPPAPAPPVKMPPIPTKEDIAWNSYSALRQDWSRHLAAAERAGVHALYVDGYKQLRARMEALAENPALEDRPLRSLGNVLAQLDEGTGTRREIEDYLAAVKDRLEYRKQVLETVAIELGKPVTGLTGYPKTLRVACLPDIPSRLAKRAKGLILNAHNPQAVDRTLRASGTPVRGGCRIPSRTGRQIPVQLAGIDPIVDRPTIHPEPPRQLRLRDTPIQIVLQQHPGLPFVHPRTDPALLAKPTERPGTPSATSPK